MLTNKRNRLFGQMPFTLGFAAAAAVMAMPAYSQGGQQEEDAEQSGGLEEITVTARRRSENLMDTPVAITAFGAGDLKARQIDQIHQVANAAPNVVWRRQSDTSNAGATVHIRGVGQDFGSASRQPGVGLYLDGVYLSQASSALMDVMDIQSIEVLRGPQGTLFGRNTIGGAVQITTVKPSDKFGGEIELLVGDYNRKRIKGSVNIPFTDTFFGKFTGSWQEKDGYVETPFIRGDDGKGGDDNTSLRAAFRWLATDNLTFDLAMDYSEHESGGPPSVLGGPINEFNAAPIPGQGGLTGVFTVDYNNFVAPTLGLPLALNQNFFVSPERYISNVAEKAFIAPGVSDPSLVGGGSLNQRAEQQSVSFTANWEINEHLAFKSITNYRELESESVIDLDELPVPIGVSGDVKDGDTFSQEFQLSGTAFDDRLNWVAGVYYFEEDVTAINPADFPTFNIVSGVAVENTSTAVFGQFTYDVTDKLSVTLGVRNTDEELESIVDDSLHYALAFFNPMVPGNYLTLPAPPNPFAFKIVPNGSFKTGSNETEPYVNVAYDFTDSLMAYVSYSEGFKGGGFTQAIAPGLTVESFDPEFVEVYEVGMKWSNDNVRVTAAWFYNDYTDLQVNTNTQLGGSTENAADAAIQGAELEVAAALTERLQVSFGVGYLDGEYKEIDARPGSTVTFTEAQRLPNVMDWQINASVSYTYPIGPGELISRLDYSFTDDYFVEAENEPELLMNSYSLLNASLTYVHESGDWEVSLQGTNITDEFYTTFGIGTLATVGYSQVTLGPPAEYSARFAYRF